MFDADHRIYLVAGAALFVIGFYSLLVQAHLLRRIMALNIMGSGVFVVYIALAAQAPGLIPDPVPQAMVLTGIVVSVCATGLALALADRVHETTGRTELTDHDEESYATGAKPALSRTGEQMTGSGWAMCDAVRPETENDTHRA